MTIRVLTGINTTGTLHLGNYCGAIRPTVRASRKPDVDAFIFMADLHALIKCQDPARIELSRMQIAASWLACGLDPDHVTFYRQSDITEIPLLNWMFNCVCPKGLMNRAHAYKAKVEANAAKSEDPDAGVSMGLFCYPILMAADILMFNANRVPVGRDQIQHLEMARDIASRFNQLYGLRKDFFVMPYEEIEENSVMLPGLDGRKMSKSYNNVIPLFEGGEKALREAISRLVTDSKAPGEPKDPDSTFLTIIFEAFSSADELTQFREDLKSGLGWGEAKTRLANQIEKEIGPMREKYEHYIAHTAELEDVLMAGAEKARKISIPFMEELRQAVGLRRFHQIHVPKAEEQTMSPAAKKKTIPVIRQYREKDGKFYFKVSEGDKALFISPGYASGKEAGIAVSLVKRGDTSDIFSTFALQPGVSAEEAQAALALLAVYEEEQAKKKA